MEYMDWLYVIIIVAAVLVALKVWQIKKRDLRIPAKAEYLTSVPESLPEKPPNIIVYLCDDLGYADIGCFGNTSIKTPNIDALADQGTKFTSFYACAPICSPSRAGLLTGRFSVRSHVPMVFVPSIFPLNSVVSLLYYSHGMDGLPQDEITIADVLKRAGYNTGMVGKWHLGDHKPHVPNLFGFDFFYGAMYSNDMIPYHIYRNDKIEIKAPADQDVLIKKLTENALAFIETSKDAPFFLYYAQPFPHNPLHASDDFRGKSTAGLYGDAVQEIDWSVGELVRVLKKHGIYDNTLIIFTSDNGPWHEGNPGYHRGRKYLPFEGGTRVPMIACWPDKIKPDMTSDTVCTNLDFFPTFLAMNGIPLPSDRVIDGKDITALLEDPSSPSPHDAIYYFVRKQIQAIRKGKWKYHTKHQSDNAAYSLLRPGPFLFDLEGDPNESYNQLMNFPQIGEELSNQLQEMQVSLEKNLRGWYKQKKEK